MTPEHGPPNYQVMRLKIVFQGVIKDIHKLQMKSDSTPIQNSKLQQKVCDPRTEKPLADIWDVNHWVALRRLALLF